MRTVTCAGLFLENEPAAAMKNMILLIFLLFTMNAHAEELNYSTTYQECIASANGEHPSMIDCLNQERERIETEVQITLSSSGHDSFQLEILDQINKTNDLWAQYIEQACDIYTYLGGQRSELLQRSCLVDITRERLKYIQNLLAAARI